VGKTGKQIRSLLTIAAMVAIVETGKQLLNALPNIEVVTLLFIVFTKVFGWKKTLAAALLFALLECIWWGFGTWSIVYFYMWPLLVWFTWLIRKQESVWAYALLAGAFGLLFGAFSSVASILLVGFKTAFAWWVSGIPYDLIHGGSNLVICALLYQPLVSALTRIVNHYGSLH
jgi:energy-coupling factor transport system substrate-specific component